MLAAALRTPAVRGFAIARVELLVAVGVTLILVAHLPYLEAWPTAHNDEARELNAFWVAAGVDPSARLLDSEFGADPLYKGGLQGLTVGLALRFGGLGLLQGRLVSLAWGGVLLALTFAVGRRLYGTTGGLVALLVLALAHPFWLSAHLVRPDIVLAAMLAGACLLALRAVQERCWRSGLGAGLLLGLALDVHLNALAFMPLVGLVFLSAGPGFWRQRAWWCFLAGLALGAAYYLLVRYLPDPAQFGASSSYWIGLDKRPPILSGDLGRILAAELGRFQGYFTEDRRGELACLAAALAIAGWRSLRERRPDPLLFGLLAAFGLFVAVVANKTEFYLVLFYPWLALVVAGAVVALAAQAGRLRPVVIVAFAVAAPFILGFQDNYEDLATAASNRSERGFASLTAELRPLVPPGASILGPPLFWLGFSDHPYTDYYVWERLRAERRERFSSYAGRLKPEILVLDAKSRYQIGINSPGFLEANGVLLKSVRHVGFDRVEIWKLS